MLRTSLIYGFLAGGIIIGSMIVHFEVSDPDKFDTNSSQFTGYLIMIIALSMIFVGIRQYRNNVQGGVIKFGKAFLVGLGISVAATFVYVAVWEVYLSVTDVDFVNTYIEATLRGLEAKGASAEVIAQKTAEMDAVRDMYKNPVLRVLITISEIFPVALIVTLVSAAILRRPDALPARA